MKKYKNRIIKISAILVCALAIMLFFIDFTPVIKPSTVALAEGSGFQSFSAPYETTTSGPEGSLVTTQTAYVPSSRIAPVSAEYAIESPEDMIYDASEGKVYIADSKSPRNGNPGYGRVLVTDLEGNVLAEIGKDTLKKPMGVAVDQNNLFVCDKENKLVYVFDKYTHELKQSIGKPTNPLVGANTPYTPIKITVDSRENIYLVSEGCVSGLMQMNIDGEFIGYVGANETSVSLVSALQNLFFSEEQRSTFLSAPRSPTNVSIDYRGLVYTVTNNAVNNSVKKLNTLGNSIMSPSINFAATNALSVDESENIYTVQSDGYITVFDSEGNLLFRFGGTDPYERFGSLANPVAISALPDGRIMVLDKNYSMVIIYERTDFSDLVFRAVDYYKDGLYVEGEDLWQEVLTYNSNFILSYKALARANMKKGNYDTALTQFKFAEDRNGYSEAYWQIRNEWLENNLIWVFVALLVVVVAVIACKIINKFKKSVFAPVRTGIEKIKSLHVKGVYPVKEFNHMRRFMRSTPDAVYEVKYHSAASVWTAIVLYVWFVVLQIISVVAKGYLFNSATVYNTNGWNTVLITTAVLFMLVLCNYFVSTVTDGEGKLKDCFITFIYALSPYLVLALPVFILSNFLTYNESIVYTICEIVMYGWSGICLFRGVMELHDYSFWKTVKNLLLTLFTFVMALLFLVVLRMLVAQLFGYFGAIFEEMLYV